MIKYKYKFKGNETVTDKKAFMAALNRAFSDNGLAGMLSLERAEKFYALTLFLLEENEKYNLTAIREPERIALAHYADCAALAKALPKGARIIDVGCGAGFPSLPVAILRPDVHVTALDSTAKRTAYVAAAADMLGLTNIRTVTARAEDAAKDPGLRESFDVATARAVAAMRILCELCLPFVRIGGSMIAMKGKNAEFELAESKKAISLLGGKLVGVENILLKGKDEDLSHPLIKLSKIAKTPTTYPRAYAQISKKPL